MSNNFENQLTCMCGKVRGVLNPTNWKRHVTSCKILKSKSKNSDILSFIKRPAATIETLNPKKLRPGK